MRKAVLFLTVALFILGLLKGVAAAVEKYAYVDLSRIFNEYNKTKEYEKDYTVKEDSYIKEREKKAEEVKKFEEKLNLLSEKEKEGKKEDLEKKFKSLQDFDREKQTDLRKEQDEKMKELFKDIDEVVKDYSEKHGISLVFNDRVLIYQSKKLDITDEIISILNKNYKK